MATYPEFFQWLVSVAIASGVVTYLAKVVIDRLAESGVAAFKADLQRQHAVELERLRADLAQSVEEHRVRFAALHAKRAEVVAELYRKLVRTQSAFESLASLMELAGEPNKAEKLGAASDEARDLVQFFREHRLFLSPEVIGLFGRMEQKLKGIYVDFLVWRPWDRESPRHHAETSMERWIQAEKVMADEVPSILTAIESEMRQLLESGLRPTVQAPSPGAS